MYVYSTIFCIIVASKWISWESERKQAHALHFHFCFPTKIFYEWTRKFSEYFLSLMLLFFGRVQINKKHLGMIFFLHKYWNEARIRCLFIHNNNNEKAKEKGQTKKVSCKKNRGKGIKRWKKIYKRTNEWTNKETK